MFTDEFIDPGLSEVGVSQALAHKAQILQFPIDIVYVSPMLRALETCWHIFHDTSIKVCVYPYITEWVHVNHDIQQHPNNYKERFSGFDWSLMPDTNFLPIVLNNQYSGLISRSTPFEFLQLIKSILPEFVESEAELFQRTIKVKEFLRKETQDKNVAVVSHSTFYQYFTAEVGDDGKIVGGKYLKNGDFEEISI
jgi:Fructose-2,6-bisphosphatase